MREIARALLLSIVVILVAFVAFAYWSGNSYWRFPVADHPAGTIGTTGTVDTKAIRDRGAAVGAQVAEAAAKVGETVDDAALTSKIKAKMVLDDSVKARAIDVATHESTVTLSGSVGSHAEHDRAIALARETSGVTRVIDKLRIGDF
jgi:hyperosmotically inducible protein